MTTVFLSGLFWGGQDWTRVTNKPAPGLLRVGTEKSRRRATVRHRNRLLGPGTISTLPHGCSGAACSCILDLLEHVGNPRSTPIAKTSSHQSSIFLISCPREATPSEDLSTKKSTRKPKNRGPRKRQIDRQRQPNLGPLRNPHRRCNLRSPLFLPCATHAAPCGFHGRILLLRVPTSTTFKGHWLPSSSATPRRILPHHLTGRKTRLHLYNRARPVSFRN